MHDQHKIADGFLHIFIFFELGDAARLRLGHPESTLTFGNVRCAKRLESVQPQGNKLSFVFSLSLAAGACVRVCSVRPPHVPSLRRWPLLSTLVRDHRGKSLCFREVGCLAKCRNLTQAQLGGAGPWRFGCRSRKPGVCCAWVSQAFAGGHVPEVGETPSAAGTSRVARGDSRSLFSVRLNLAAMALR